MIELLIKVSVFLSALWLVEIIVFLLGYRSVAVADGATVEDSSSA